LGLQIGTQLQNKEENVHLAHEEPLTENECRQAGLPYGFDGGMYAFGKHVYNSGKEKKYVEYCGTHWFQPHIRVLSELVQSLLSSCFHWEAIGIQHGLEGYDEKPPKCLGGDKGLTKSINVSVNLANPAHYNCNDDGTGIGVWFEKEKSKHTEVYFVMPNILVEDSNGVMRYGLTIKLKDGCVISWDGTNIHHCMSMRIDPKCPSK